MDVLSIIFCSSLLGTQNISQVRLTGVKEVFEKHAGEESKGIKVHFRLDDSGILRVDKVDITFEKKQEVNEQESTLSSKILDNLNVRLIVKV